MEKRSMSVKKQFKNEIDAKLEQETPHLTAFEKPAVRKTPKKWWIPVVSSLAGVACLALAFVLLLPSLSAGNKETGNAALSGPHASEIDNNTTGQSFSEASGYFSIAESEANKRGLFLDAFINSAIQEANNINVSFFFGYQGIDGSTLYQNASTSTGLNGKTLSEITSSATLKAMDALSYESHYTGIWSDKDLVVNSLALSHEDSWGYRHYRKTVLAVLDFSSFADGQGSVSFSFSLDGLGDSYSSELSIYFSKNGTSVSLSKTAF
jgi:hypothetical protein